MGFEPFERPKVQPKTRKSTPRVRVAKGAHLHLTRAAMALLGFIMGQEGGKVTLMFDRERRLLGIRADPTGNYSLPKTGAISCRDFLTHFKVEDGAYDATQLSSLVVSAEVKVRPR